MRAINAKEILVSSFAVAEATLKSIREKNPQKVTFLIIGQYHGAGEDVALADYVIAKIVKDKVDLVFCLLGVKKSSSAKLISPGIHTQYHNKDLNACFLSTALLLL